MNEPAKSKAKALVKTAKDYVGRSKRSIRLNRWDRDWTLEMVLDIVERLKNMGEDRLVLNVLDIYEEIQNLRYTGPAIDQREIEREAQRRRREMADSSLESNT